MNVCWGGTSTLAHRGGTTIGNTFVAKIPDGSGGVIDPRKYRDYVPLIEHEFTHTLQWQTLGVGMVDYLLWEARVAVVNWVLEDMRLPPIGMGCGNPYEISASLVKGGYLC